MKVRFLKYEIELFVDISVRTNSCFLVCWSIFCDLPRSRCFKGGVMGALRFGVEPFFFFYCLNYTMISTGVTFTELECTCERYFLIVESENLKKLSCPFWKG